MLHQHTFLPILEENVIKKNTFTEFFNNLQRMVHFLNMYKIYFLNYQNCENLLVKLKKERHKFIEREIEKVRQIDADTQTETANHVKDKRDKETQNKTT